MASTGAGIGAHALEGWFLSLRQPPGLLPRGVFGPAWLAIYVSMGVAGWLVWRRCGGSHPIRLWGWQLALNAAWVPAFLGLRSPLLGLAVLAALLPMIVLTIRSFAGLRPLAAWLMVPYGAWTLYAFYLTLGFCWLNPV